jgi:hypothetical protein
MKWTSVKERLPTINDVYDHKTGGRSDFAIVFAKGISATPEIALFTIQKDGTVAWDFADDGMEWFVITHWMIPEIPGDN